MDASAQARATEQLDALGRDGLRALGVAWRDVPGTQDAISREDEHDLVFAGFAVFSDPPKESAGRTVAALGRTGIDIKILTGDTEPVTTTSARSSAFR
jgi:Mg2+-importing ATPase